jgi:hypothetical protein
MTRHELKCWPVYFGILLSGVKTFEVRKGTDRTYYPCDELLLKEWDPEEEGYTGRGLLMRVTYVMNGQPFLPDDVWVMSVEKITDHFFDSLI